MLVPVHSLWRSRGREGNTTFLLLFLLFLLLLLLSGLLCPKCSQQLPTNTPQLRASCLAPGCPCRAMGRSTQEIRVRNLHFFLHKAVMKVFCLSL